MKINLVFVLIFVCFCYLVLPFLLLCIKNRNIKNVAIYCAFVCFLAVLFVGVFGKIDFDSQYVTIGFDFDGQWCSKTFNCSFSNLTTFDVITNLVMLIPIGMFVYYFLSSKKWWLRLLTLFGIGILSGTLIETFQFILPIQRSVQLSDIVFNTISVLFGGLLCKFYLKLISIFLKNR
ncbi:MAG: VanZ family protein [Candidatus Caccovivens sp.]